MSELVKDLLNGRRKSIQQEVEYLGTQIADAQAVVDQIRGELKALVEEDKACLEELQKMCDHKGLRSRTQVSYQEGGYYDRSQSTYHITCLSCNKVLKVEVESGSYA